MRDNTSTVAGGESAESDQIVLSLLEAVERDEGVSQRRLSSDLGIALGLVNAYLKRCVKKGLVKVQEAPARRYAYYLTPHGFSEKSRLTFEYLSYSFSFFRAARADCTEALETARQRGWKTVALAGVSDLAEVAVLCALESGVSVTNVFDATSAATVFVGLPVTADIENAIVASDGFVLTDIKDPAGMLALLTQRLGRERVLVPALLSGRILRARKTRIEPRQTQTEPRP